MSWDADLYQEYGPQLGEWNYTHNCNFMANEVLYPPDEENLSWNENSWRTSSDVANWSNRGSPLERVRRTRSVVR